MEQDEVIEKVITGAWQKAEELNYRRTGVKGNVNATEALEWLAVMHVKTVLVMDSIRPFKDNYGNTISVGDTILIEDHLNYSRHEGKKAEVIWDATNGMYEYRIEFETIRKRKDVYTGNFYGVKTFKKIEDNG